MSTVVYAWVSCSAELSWDASRYVHVINNKGALDTLCGHSATHPDIWRRDKRKPHCPACIAKIGE